MEDLLFNVIKQEITGAALGLVSIGIVTALVPLAIAALNSRNDKEVFYRKVILRSVINQTRILFGFICLFLPLVFWSENALWSNSLILITWLVGLFLIYPTFTSHILWFSGETKLFIKRYFQKNDNPNSRVSDWTEYWSTDMERLDEDFVEVFFDNIYEWNSSTDNEKLKMLNPLIFTIAPVMNKANVISFSGDDGLLARLLKLRLKMWESEQHNRYAQKNRSGSAHQHWGRERIDEMISNIFLRSLEENYAFGFFHSFEKHLEHVLPLEKESIRTEEGTELKYVGSLLYRFYNTLFDHVHESNEERDIWDHYFPEILKIKDKNLQKERSDINIITLDSYFNYATKRLTEQKERTYDWQLDKVMRGILPDVNPSIWGIFTELHAFPHSPQTAIGAMIEHGKVIGSYNMSSVTVWGDVSDEEISRLLSEQEQRATNETKKVFEQFRFGYVTSTKYLTKCLEIAREYSTEKLDEHATARKQRIIQALEFVKGVYTLKK